VLNYSPGEFLSPGVFFDMRLRNNGETPTARWHAEAPPGRLFGVLAVLRKMRGNFGRRLAPPAATRQAGRTQEIRSLGQPACRCFEIPASLKGRTS